MNLGLRAANSAQELVSALPFVERETTFVVCSGLNNFSTARGAPGLDPLFGPMHHENHMARLASVPITRLARLVDDALGHFSDRRLRRELSGRRRARLARRIRPYRRLEKRVRGRFSGPADEPVKPAPRPSRPPSCSPTPPPGSCATSGCCAGSCPIEARVVFALQPLALYTDKELSPEEEELFEALDVLQPRRWPELKRMLETFWGDYAATLQEGCAANGIPFVDLSRGEYEGLVLRRPRAHDRPRARHRGCDAGADGVAMKILDWLRGDDSDEDEKPEEDAARRGRREFPATRTIRPPIRSGRLVPLELLRQLLVPAAPLARFSLRLQQPLLRLRERAAEALLVLPAARPVVGGVRLVELVGGARVEDRRVEVA